MKLPRVAVLAACLTATPGFAATFSVDSTGDEPDATINGTCATAGGACTLRAAIQEANPAAGPHTIAFAIPGEGPYVITLGSALPSLTRAGTTIDGYTQPGTQVNTNPTGPLNSVLLVEVGHNDTVNCIQINASDVTVRGLAVAGCNRGISVTNGFGSAISGITIAGNYIGTDAGGTIAVPNDVQGIQLGFSQGGSTSATIGGSAPADRNIISGNATGVTAVSNFNGGFNVAFLGNLIGLSRAGDPLGNDRGFDLFGDGPTNITIGGLAPDEANEIAWNVTGIRIVGSSDHVTIRGNSIHDNSGIGINLGNDAGVTANDPGDGDNGANGLQNFPIVSSVELLGAITQGGGTRIQGVLHSTASTAYDVDFYENDACSPRPQDFLQGRTYIGSAQVTTDAEGNGPFDVTLPVAIADGAPVSATATDPIGNTSEFSQRMPFSMAPTSGAPAGGTTVTVQGTDFAAGATVTIGGQPATDVNIISSKTLQAKTPVLAAGGVHDLTVTNLDTSMGTLPHGYVSDFLDVPGPHQFHSFVTTLVRNGITAGVGGGNYGVAQDTLRQQMAVFLLRAKYGLCFVPPPCAVQVFDDVPCSLIFAPWINELVAQGITGGCGGGNNYCPTNPVLRQQMAVLLLRTLEGTGYTPPACTVETFTDVPCSSPFAAWIYELVARNITAGCGGGLYCPTLAANRGQMATFLVKTFNLQ